ncbi:unnamed protein product [Pleuronectes platessa]|uniref:Uncharacterized protein n=1 Tax=Pleuronectes platessa TaxID=8262 RepID=A0A9N7ZE91_PLEPL|nr:unnamed protein product [Pleuronectes platessa]CAB1459962.1 unnamed protein product [Pleuronectes platessa]
MSTVHRVLWFLFATGTVGPSPGLHPEQPPEPVDIRSDRHCMCSGPAVCLQGGLSLSGGRKHHLCSSTILVWPHQGRGDEDGDATCPLADKSPSSGRKPYVNWASLQRSPPPLNK